MGFVQDVENQVRDFLSGNYEVQEFDYIPAIGNVSLGKKVMKVPLCTFFIDMRNSSDLLFDRWKQTSAKIHKTFLTVVSNVVVHYGGRIRSFQGDGLLAFWPAKYKKDINQAVTAAMVTKWMLDVKFETQFSKFVDLDFGIGLDYSDAFILRAGLSNNPANNDLVFIGKCVNLAVAIANQAKGPYHVEISEIVYENLFDQNKYGKDDDGDEVDMWEYGNVTWNDRVFDTKVTSSYISVKD